MFQVEVCAEARDADAARTPRARTKRCIRTSFRFCAGRGRRIGRVLARCVYPDILHGRFRDRVGKAVLTPACHFHVPVATTDSMHWPRPEIPDRDENVIPARTL